MRTLSAPTRNAIKGCYILLITALFGLVIAIIQFTSESIFSGVIIGIAAIALGIFSIALATRIVRSMSQGPEADNELAVHTLGIIGWIARLFLQ